MDNKLKNINYTYLFILVTVSFLWFILKEHTAYEWPAIDMMPFFERYYDPSFLINDFFTNAISNEPNPRWNFGYLIIGLAELFQAHWYTISYSIKVILVVIMPVLYYLVLYIFIGKFINEKKLKNIQILIFLAILIVIHHPTISLIFSIACWRPYFVQSTPQTLSLFFGLLAIVLREINLTNKYYKYIPLLLFGASTLIHPAIGLFVIIFYYIVNYQSVLKNYRQFLYIFLFGFVIPVIFIKIIYAPRVPIETSDFIRIYTIENHSYHYHLIDFAALTPFSGIYSFILMTILLIIPIIYFHYFKLKNCLILTYLFLGSFLLAILCQYIFIDIFPSKIVASIGPVRFTQFIYWMIVISWSIMLSNLWLLNKINFNFNFRKIYFLIIGGGYIIIGILMIDSPRKDIYLQDKEMYKFIEKTEKDSVFTSCIWKLQLNIPNIGKRAVFVGNGFPFNETYFKEHQKRKSLLYGSKEYLNKIKGKGIAEKMNNFFRQKSPNDFLNISKKYKLDYVVIESQYSSKFKDYIPRFENDKIKIYKVSDFFHK